VRGRLGRLLASPLILFILLIAVRAWARPGGGSSFSGGSGGGGGGSSSDDDFILELVLVLVQIAIDYPQVGLPLIGVVILFFVVTRMMESDTGRILLVVLGVTVLAGLCAWKPHLGIGVVGAVVIGVGIVALIGSTKKKPAEWSSTKKAGPTHSIEAARTLEAAPVARRTTSSARRTLESLRKVDPEFSLVVLEDFLDALYAEVQVARGQQQLGRWSGYLASEARASLEDASLAAVEDVIVGAMRLCTADLRNDRVTLDVEYEANRSERKKDGGAHHYYVLERWSFSRKAGARSRPPDKARVFGCPNCGAALESIAGGMCTYCKQNVDTGEKDWLVESVQALRKETRGPILTEQAPEAGTDAPTVVDEDLTENLSQLMQKDPQFSQAQLAQRIKLVFETLQVAWSTRDWLKARPFLSDRLWSAQNYWVEAYKRAHLRNVNAETAIERVQLARVGSDKHFDSVTVRLYAHGLDYTVDESDKLVCGSQSQTRRYSEYWTFIRGAGARGPAHSEPKCPNCGGELKVTMAGNCEFCKARVTLGEFDWVLSRIEQDEVYGD
jgi:Tim44-like domain